MRAVLTLTKPAPDMKWAGDFTGQLDIDADSYDLAWGTRDELEEMAREVLDFEGIPRDDLVVTIEE